MVNKKALFLGTQVRQVTQASPSQEWNLALDPGPWHTLRCSINLKRTSNLIHPTSQKYCRLCSVAISGSMVQDPPANGSVWDPGRSLQHTPAAPSTGCASVLQHSPEQTGDQKTTYRALFGQHWLPGPIILMGVTGQNRVLCSGLFLTALHIQCVVAIVTHVIHSALYNN